MVTQTVETGPVSQVGREGPLETAAKSENCMERTMRVPTRSESVEGSLQEMRTDSVIPNKMAKLIPNIDLANQ